MWLRVALGSFSSQWARHTHTHTHVAVVRAHRYTSHAAIYRGIETGKGPHESTGTQHNAGIWTWGTVLNLGDVIPWHSPPLPALHPSLPPTHNRSLSWACTPASPHSPTNWYPLKAAAGQASLHISNSTGEPGGNKTNDPHGSIHMQRLEKMRHYKSLSLFVTQSFFFFTNLGYFTISCFVILASQCLCESTLSPQSSHWWLTLVYGISCLFFLDTFWRCCILFNLKLFYLLFNLILGGTVLTVYLYVCCRATCLQSVSWTALLLFFSGFFFF